MEGRYWKQMGGLRLLVLMILMVTVMMDCALGEQLYRVGDSKGWNQNVNYTEWSSRQHIYVDDWIIFYFDKHLYNVLEVNETSYETCNDRDFIKNITRGGRDVFQLTEARPYYFLSGGGYCWHGMKLVVHVQEIPPTPAPAPDQNASPCNIIGNRMMILFIMFSTTFAWTAHFKLY